MIHCENGHVTCKGKGKELLLEFISVASSMAEIMADTGVEDAVNVLPALVRAAAEIGVQKKEA